MKYYSKKKQIKISCGFLWLKVTSLSVNTIKTEGEGLNYLLIKIYMITNWQLE